MLVRRTKKILIMGLPGSGKTTLAYELARELNAMHYNADQVRSSINRHLGFSLTDRIEQARTMKKLCDTEIQKGRYVIADFVCPTQETREAFGINNAFVIWVDRIQMGRFEDTNKLFVPPETYDVRVTGEDSAKIWAERISQIIQQPKHSHVRPRRRAQAAQSTFFVPQITNGISP